MVLNCLYIHSVNINIIYVCSEQESSRKRRREKRETLLKAYAKMQADAGNVERAEAITKQMAVNMNNIKIHLKRGYGGNAAPAIGTPAMGIPSLGITADTAVGTEVLRPAKVHRLVVHMMVSTTY